MPKKESSKIDRDELIEALTEKRVIEAQVKCFMESLTSAIEMAVQKRMKPIEDALDDKVEEAVERITDPKLKSLQKSVSGLREENRLLKESLYQQETFSRADNLIFCGIPESPDSGQPVVSETDNIASGQVTVSGSGNIASNLVNNRLTCNLIVDLCNTKLGIAVTINDISAAHRLQRGKAESSRPIIVRFTSRRIRDEVFNARRLLRPPKGSAESIDQTKTSIYINEHLSKASAEIFFRTRQLLRQKEIAGTWTIGGEVFIKKTSEGKPIKVRAISELPVED